MNITDKMVERAQKAVENRIARMMEGHVSTNMPGELARAALDAALGDVEPLGRVIADALRPHEGRMIIRCVETTGVYSVILEAPDGEDVYRSAPDIDAAIRAAVADAKD